MYNTFNQNSKGSLLLDGWGGGGGGLNALYLDLTIILAYEDNFLSTCKRMQQLDTLKY